MGVENMGAAPPDASDTFTDAALSDQPEPAADSSTAAPEGEKRDLLSVVRDAVRPKDVTASPAGEQQDQPTAGNASSAPEPKEQDDEGFSDVPFHKHPRFRQLVDQRDQFRKTAEQYEKVQDFLSQQGLSEEDAADALLLQAQIKTDPVGAWQKMKPMLEDLAIRAGVIVAPEYADRVRKGEMTKATALELSRMKAASTSAEAARKALEDRQKAGEAERHRQAFRQSIADWERDVKLRDPDFSKKIENIQKELAWLHLKEGQARTPQDAKRQLDAAYAAVNQRVAPPQRAPVRPVTGGRVAGGNQTTGPRTMLDIVKAGGSQG